MKKITILRTALLLLGGATIVFAFNGCSTTDAEQPHARDYTRKHASPTVEDYYPSKK